MLVICALAALFILGLLPLVVMAYGLGLDDLTRLVEIRTLSLLGRTFALGLGAAGIAFLLGLPFGFFVARTDMPGAALLRPLGAVPLFLPTLLLAVAWAPLCELRGGLAATLILGISTFPLVALFSARAFERIDAACEEAALITGGLGAVLRMELPLVLPAAFAGTSIAFAFAVNDYATPDYVSSVGPKFNVFADEVFATWGQLQEPGRALGSALPLIIMTLMMLLPTLALRRRGSLAPQGRTFRAPAPLNLGCWRTPALLFCLLPLTAGVFVPLGRMFFEAMTGPTLLADGNLNFSSAQEALQRSFGLAIERARSDLSNSILFAIAAGLVAVPIGLVIGHAIERGPRHLGRAFELVALIPLATPAVLFGIGSIVLWSRPITAELYDSPAMAILVFAGRFMPFCVLLLSGAVASMDPRLEESAALSGERPARRLFSIVVPNAFGSLAGSFVLVFVFTVRELDAAILVPAANHTAMLRLFNGVHFDRDEYVAALSLLIVFTILLPGLLWTLFSRRRLAVLS